ncbi:MAG: glycosyltransferase [Candidatus Rokubacteria bacterium 13_1_40CM_68_15]|nr:MAG: glycosyltransferase [Candidatus Rokubacteria bacterium 13_1_40CM_68_15]
MRASTPASPRCRSILGMRVHATSYDDASSRVMAWAEGEDRRRYVCVTTVHTVMEAHDDVFLQRIVNHADLVTPDGMPLVWGLRLLGAREAARVYGPELTPRVLAAAARDGVPIGFYGGAPDVLDKLVAVARERFPGLRIVYALSPPFRPISPEEDTAIVDDINRSGARILFVGLGCPKQDRWMAAHRSRVNAVMLGVGAAFDFLAGNKAQAPRWMQDRGLEWIFRLACEPRRLWWRYLWHNPRFVLLFALQLLRQRWLSSSLEGTP